MKTYRFDHSKYANGINMDLGKIEETPVFDFSDKVHCTDFFEIMIFVRGNGHVQLDAQTVPLTDSHFLFIAPYQKRRWFVDRDQLEGYFLIFEQDFLAEFFSDKLFIYRLQYFYNHRVLPYFLPDKRLFSFEHDVFEEIAHELNHTQNDSQDLLRSILYYLLIKLNREYCGFHGLQPDTQLNNTAFRFKEAVEQHITTMQRVEDYARLLNTSRISLNSAVKKQFGSTATDMIKERLLVEIKSQLLFSNHNVAEIALKLGYSEPQHLIRFFKKRTGNTPLQYRSNYQNGYS